jgi:hypothetical protein
MPARSPSLAFRVTVACLCAILAGGCADRATPPQTSAPSARIVSVEGASTTYHTRDWNGQTVTVRVPSQSAADIRGKDAEGTVRGTMTAVDPASHRVTVRTAERQTIVLAMAPGSLAGLKPGDRFICTVPAASRTETKGGVEVLSGMDVRSVWSCPGAGRGRDARPGSALCRRLASVRLL